MKKLIFISLSILIISLLVSCDKAEDFSILEGRVIEKGSNKPIPDAMIVIQHCGGNFGQSGGVSCSNIDTIYSDKQGNFKHLIELTGDEYNTGAGNYFLVPSKEKYFSYQLEDYGMPTRGTLKKDMVLIPTAWLKLHVKAVNNYGLNDLFKISPISSGELFAPDYAQNLEYTKYYKRQGNDTLSFDFVISKDGLPQEYFKKKVYLPALDTTTFNLFF